MKLTGVSLIVAFGVLGLAPAVGAQTETTSRTVLVYVAPTLKGSALSPSEHVLSFSMPVEVPGARLSAGPYIFRFLAPSVVQVLSVTRSKVHATFFTIPAYGTGDESRERIKFELTGEDRPPRIAAWYLPWSTGREFLYPKPKRDTREPAEREAEEEITTGWR